jgi:hypothetical protein
MGYERLLPVPLATLASEAMLEFLLRDPVINRGVRRLLTVGPFDPAAREYLQRHANQPVSFADKLPAAGGLDDTLVFVSDRNHDTAATDAAFATGRLNILRERDLAARFSL